MHFIPRSVDFIMFWVVRQALRSSCCEAERGWGRDATRVRHAGEPEKGNKVQWTRNTILVTGGGMVVDADSLTTRYADVSIHPPAESDTPVRLRIHLAGRMRYGYIEAR